jgi:hypothetical protein
MELDTSNINVEINIAGSVENSQITGVSIYLPEGERREIRGSLFRKFFIEYLGLPSLLELQSRLEVWHAGRDGRLFEYGSIAALWSELVSHLHNLGVAMLECQPRQGLAPGMAVRIHNLQLCPFVNRNPGYQYAYPSANRSELGYEDIMVGVPLIITEDFVAKNGGLGDIRFSPHSGRHLLNAIPHSGVMGRSYGLGSLKLEELARIDTRELFSHGGRFGHPWLEESHTAYGMPVVVSDLVYANLKTLLDDYGAVAIEEMTGTLEVTTWQPSLQWYPGIPKLALCVEDRHAIKGISRPHPSVGSAWTVVDLPGQERRLFAYWPFLIGIENYRSSLRRATEIIGEEISKNNAVPLFEFDSESNWFSKDTPFTPDKVAEIYKRLDSKDVVHKQKYRQDVAHVFDIFLERYCGDQLRTLEWEFGDVSSAQQLLKAAAQSCALGIAEMRAGNLTRALDNFRDSLGSWPRFVWSSMFEGICLALSEKDGQALERFRYSLESAADDLATPMDRYSDSFATWYLMCWVLYDYIARRFGSRTIEFQFYPIEEAEHWSREARFGLHSDQRCWVLRFGETLPDDSIALDQLLTCWLGSSQLVTLQYESAWVVSEALKLYQNTNETKHGDIAGPARRSGITRQMKARVDAVVSEPQSEFLLRLKDAMGTGYFSTVGLRYPLLSNDYLSQIATCDFEVAFSALTSYSFRLRRLAERKLLELGDVGRLIKDVQDRPHRIQQAVAWVLGEVGRRQSTMNASVRSALVRLLTTARVEGIRQSAFRACVRSNDTQCGTELFNLYAGRGKYALQDESSLFRELGADARWLLHLGLGHTSPVIRAQCRTALKS